MDPNAGARAACVTILTILVVFLLSAIAIFRLDTAPVAGALRAALACLIFIYLAYLWFEVKILTVMELLFPPRQPGQLHENWFSPPPPLSSVIGTSTPPRPGSSVGRGLSPEEAAGGGRASPSPSSEAGDVTSEPEPVAEPSPIVSSGGYYRPPPTRAHRSSSRRWIGTSDDSASGGSSSEVTDLTSDVDGSLSALLSPSRAGGRSRHVYGGRQADRSSRRGGAMAYTRLKHTFYHRFSK